MPALRRDRRGHDRPERGPGLDKYDPPLLPGGFHQTDLVGLHRLCVEYFPKSAARARLMETLSTIFRSINDSSISARLWIGGGFLTEKENPEDVELTMIVKETSFKILTANQRAFFDWFRSTSLYLEHRCYTYALVLDDTRDDWEVLQRYWLRQYGFDDQRRKKAIAEILVPKPPL